MSSSTLITLYSLLIILSAFTLPFDTQLSNKHGTPFNEAKCNKDTVIDFSFSSNSILTLPNTVSSKTSSTINFLDVLGEQIKYTLSDGQLVRQEFITGLPKAFIFKFTQSSKTVYVAIPIIDGGAAIPSIVSQGTIALYKSSDPPLSSLKGASSSIALSAFNFLNDFTYSNFYTVMDTNSYSTLLISKVYYSFTQTLTETNTLIFDPTTFIADARKTGEVLCWGSQQGYGFFQTHMRESVPLWTNVVLIFFFWMFNFISSEVTPEIYEQSFVDNKWSCWSLYSVFYLCHEDFFTRTSRTILIIVPLIFQGSILAFIYALNGETSNRGIIIWSAIVAFICSYIIEFLMGKFLLSPVYGEQLQKFETLKIMHKQADKEKHSELEDKVIGLEQRMYGRYYVFYVIAILFVAVFSTLSVHYMQKTHRDFYYLHWYWLASLGISFAIQHLFFDPILTGIFGNTQLYRSRGYYYNGKLGELARHLE